LKEGSTDTSAAVTRILAGAIDLHYHSAPSPFPRRLTTAEAAQHYADAGFRGVVMKSHHHSTVMELIALQKVVLDDLPLEIFGGVALNGAVGGLNPRAVDLALKMGGKIVWFPTIAGLAHIDYHSRHVTNFPSATVPLMTEAPIRVLDEGGELKPEVVEIIDLIAESDAILASGHMTPVEVEAVMVLAHERGVRKLLVNHPDFILEMEPEQVLRLAELGAVTEHILIRYDDELPGSQPLDALVEWIGLLGPERTVISSDLGQRTSPLPGDAFQRVVAQLLVAGVAEEALTTMLQTNPATLLGIAA
jgi:Family of unknown function (DUF6282)